MTFFILPPTQKILFYSAMASVIVQTLCVYYFVENKQKFQIDKSFGYLFFSCVAYFFYYKMIMSS